MLLDLEVGIETVRQREVRIELECLSERFLRRAPILLDVPVPILRQNPVDPAQPSPGGSVPGIEVDTPTIQVARGVQASRRGRSFAYVRRTEL
jgi:hypothetical protein